MTFDMSKSREIIGENNQLAAVQQNGDALRYFKRAWIIEEIEREFGFEIEIVNLLG